MHWGPPGKGCHFWRTKFLILGLLKPRRVLRRYDNICLVLIFQAMCSGPSKWQNIGLATPFSWFSFIYLFITAKQPGKNKVVSPQNAKSWISWQQDCQGQCFPNSLLCSPARTWSPCSTVWRIAGCLVLLPNVNESKYQTPLWNRIAILHPSALTIHDLAAHRISFHIPLVCCFPNCAKCTTNATATASEKHACTAQIC